mgnify:CR=1 FL=1
MGTVNQILNETSILLGDPYQVVWPAAELKDYLTLAIKNLAQSIEIAWDIKIIEIVSGTREYLIPRDVLEIKRITYNLANKLYPTKGNELDLISSTWPNTSATIPLNYYFDHQDIDTLALYPKPNTSGITLPGDSEYGTVVGATGWTLTGDSEYGVPVRIYNSPAVSGEWFFVSGGEYGDIVEYHQETDNLMVIASIVPEIPEDNNTDFILRSLGHVLTFKVTAMALQREGTGQNLDGVVLLEQLYAQEISYLQRTYAKRIN